MSVRWPYSRYTRRSKIKLVINTLDHRSRSQAICMKLNKNIVAVFKFMKIYPISTHWNGLCEAISMCTHGIFWHGKLTKIFIFISRFFRFIWYCGKFSLSPKLECVSVYVWHSTMTSLIIIIFSFWRFLSTELQRALNCHNIILHTCTQVYYPAICMTCISTSYDILLKFRPLIIKVALMHHYECSPLHVPCGWLFSKAFLTFLTGLIFSAI